jgi:hypothetical protein
MWVLILINVATGALTPLSGYPDLTICKKAGAGLTANLSEAVPSSQWKWICIAPTLIRGQP